MSPPSHETGMRTEAPGGWRTWRGWWDYVPLLARVLLTASLALLVSALVMLYVSARDDAQHAGQTLQQTAQREVAALPVALLDAIIVGDFATVQQTLARVAQREEIGRLAYVDMQGTRLQTTPLARQRRAPDWFARWTGLREVAARVPVEVGGRVYGHFEIEVRAEGAIDQIWLRLLRHLSILALAIGLDFVGIWLILRQGLRPLHLLDQASAAIERGDYHARVPVRGSPELRHVMGAFNDMAQAVEANIHALALAEGRVSAILRSIGDGLIVTDTAMRVSYLNPVAESLTGWSLQEAQGRAVNEVFVIANALTGGPAEIPVGRVIETGKVAGLANHTLLIARDGRRLHIADSAAPVRDASGDLAGVVLVFRDVSEAYRLRVALEENRARLALALKGADLGLWDWDLQTGQAVYDKRWAGMLGYAVEEVEPRIATWEGWLHADDMPAARRALEEHLLGLSPQYEAEYRMRTKTGEWRWILSRGRVTARDADGRPLRMTGTHLDVHERRKAQQEVERLAYYDPLTGLPNRRLLYDRLRQLLAWSRREGSCGAVLFVDLDHFKHINDLRGHGTGDLLLKEVAYRLSRHLREGDTVARWGGDEFVILLADLGRAADEAAAHAREVAMKLLAQLSTPYLFDGESYTLGGA